MRLVGVLWTFKPVPAFGAWKQGIKCFLSPWVARKTCIVLLDYRFGDFDSLPFGTRRRLQSKSFSVGSSVVCCSIVSFALQWELSVVNTSDIVMSSGNILIKELGGADMQSWCCLFSHKNNKKVLLALHLLLSFFF